MALSGAPTARPAEAAAAARGSLPWFAALYAAMYCAFGALSPYLPSFLALRGLSVRGVGLVLATGMAVRLVAGPLAGMAGDLLGTRRVLALAAAAAGTLIFLYLAPAGLWPFVLVGMVHAAVMAPLVPLADALALTASAREGTFPYGWVRGIGSAAFVVGTLASGQIIARAGIASIILTASAFLLLMIVPIPRLPPSQSASRTAVKGGLVTLLALPMFCRLLLVAALVIGSHAMSDAFAVIHWRTAGLGDVTVSILWSEAVLSEVVVFFTLGPFLLRRIGPGRSAAFAAGAGVLRWAVVAVSTSTAALAATQVLHGLTFSLTHLACMQVIAAIVPEKLSATAQTVYNTLCLGIASVTLTLASGALYERFGAPAFSMMSFLCLAAVPLAFGLSAKVAQSHRP